MKNILFSLLFFSSTIALYSQAAFDFEINAPGLEGLIPQSPEAAGLSVYSQAPVNLHTGNPQISIPLMVVGQNSYQLPISISHFAGGNRVEDLATNTGLNNSLNAGGVITRQIRDQPDDAYTFRKLSMCLETGIGDFCRNCETFCEEDVIGTAIEDCIECEGQYHKELDATGRFDSVGFLYHTNYIKEIALEENLPTDGTARVLEEYERRKFINGNYLRIETVSYSELRADDIILDIDLSETSGQCQDLLDDIVASYTDDDIADKFVDFVFDGVSIGTVGAIITNVTKFDLNIIGIILKRAFDFVFGQTENIPFIRFKEVNEALENDISLINCFSYDVLRPEFDYRDTESDLYSFNFNGYAGQFVFGNDGIPKIFSDQDLKIEHQITQAPTFPSSDFTDTGLSSVFGGGIQNFTITTPDGIRYIFAEREMSITSSEGQNYDNILFDSYLNECAPPFRRPYRIDLSNVRGAVTSWYLSEVIMPTGLKELQLNYEKTALVNHNNLSYQYSTCNVSNVTATSAVNIILGKRIKDIQWRTGNTFGTNGKVEFNYTQPRADLYYPTDLLNAIGSNYAQASGLTSVKWLNKDNEAIRETALTYDYHLEAALSPAGNCSPSSENAPWVNAHRKRLRLKTVTTRGWDEQGNLAEKEPYQLDYNDVPLPSRHSPHQDFWGFYNGTKSNFTVPHVFAYPEYYARLANNINPPNLLNGQSIFSILQSNLAGLGPNTKLGLNCDRSPDESFAKGGMLSKITFPLGGFEEFDFELHRFRNINAININGGIGTGGGLRIKTSRVGDAKGNIITQNYNYLEVDGAPASLSSGKITDVPIFAKCDVNCFEVNLGTGATLYSRPQNSIGKVVYSKVIIDHNGNGRTENFFRVKEDSYYNDDMFSCPEQDYECFNILPIIKTNARSCNVPDFAPFPPTPNLDWNRGQLEKQITYDEDGNEIQSVENTYTLVNIGKSYSIQATSNLTKFGTELINEVYSSAYQILSGDLRMTQSIETLDGVSRTTTFEYGSSDHKNVTASYYTNSDNKLHRTEIDFAHEKNVTCLLDDYMISVPVETRKYVDGVFQGGMNVLFQDFNSGQCLPKKITEIFKNQSTLDRIIITGYTTDAKPTGITQMNFPETKYFWSSGLLDSTRQGIFLTSYDYHTDIRLQKSVTDIDAQVSNFSYDGLQRLRTASSRNGNILTSFDYSGAYDISRNPSALDNRLITTIEYSDAPTQTSVQTFDGLGRSLQTLLNGVVKNEVIYDNLGRIKQQTYLSGNFTTLEYDNSPLNRVLKEIYPDGTFSTMTYGSQGDYYKVSGVDENSNTTTTLTDILGRPYQIINALGDATSYEYSDNRTNQPTKIIPPMGDDAKFTYHYTFDERVRLETKTLPQGGTMSYTYDDDNDLLETSTDANGNVVTYIYDVYGREIEKQLAGNTINTNTYDVGGDINIGKMTQSEVWKLGTNTPYATNYKYDAFGRIEQTTVVNHVGGQDITDFTYNHADWQLAALRQHTGPENLSIGMGYEYDGFGRVTKTIHSLNGQAQLLSQNAWNNRDQLTRKILGNGLQKIDYEYNNRGWLTRINQPLPYSLLAKDCVDGSTYLPPPNLPELLDSEIFCGQAEENLAYILANRFGTPNLNVDCYNPCENTGYINTNTGCSPTESNNQLASLSTARVNMKIAFSDEEQRICADGSTVVYNKPDAAELGLPVKLYRLRLCNGTQVYVFENQVSFISGTYSIIQEIEIQDINQMFNIKDEQGITNYVNLEELIHFVVEGTSVYIDNFQPNQNPCSPRDFNCSTEEENQNENIFANIEANNSNLNTSDLSYPTFLYRVKICGLEETYLLPDELAQFPDNYAILQSIKIDNPNQTFMVGNTFDYFDGDDLFFLELHYNEAQTAINAIAQKNGNIAFMDWQVKDQTIQSYGFQYDALDRIKGAKHSIANYIANDAFGVNNITYDKNGNIKTIIRNQGESSCPNVIDDLVYGYDGNQLTSVTDNVPSSYKDFGFKPGAGGTYTYDFNGNLKFDPHKGATFTYNHLNLPSTIAVANQGTLTYEYDANGTKLSKSNGSEIRDYANGIEYIDNQLEAIYHEEGRIIKKNGNFEWQWHFKDHLGNTRILFSDVNNDGSIDANNELLSVQNYYPFGMSWESNTNTDPDQRHLYNGKELDTDFGVNLYFYGARLHDPALGRFTGVDPISDQFAHVSTYNYAENEPIANIDLHGLQKLRATVLNNGLKIKLARGTSERDPLSVTFTNRSNNRLSSSSSTVSDLRELSNDLDLGGMGTRIKSDSRFRSPGVGIDFQGFTNIADPSFILPFNQADLEGIPQVTPGISGINLSPLETSPVNLEVYTTTQIISPSRSINYNNSADIRYISNTGEIILPPSISNLLNDISTNNASMSQFNLTLRTNLNNSAQTNAANTALNNVVTFIQNQTGISVTPNLINATSNKGFSINASGQIPAVTREVPRLRTTN